MLRNFPSFISQIGNPSGPEPLIAIEQPQESEIQDPTPSQFLLTEGEDLEAKTPNPRRENTASSSKTTVSSGGPIARQRKSPRTRVSTRAPPRTRDRILALLEFSENLSPDRPGIENTFSQAPRYQLRANRAPRYRCGTYGSRNCSCVQLIGSKSPDHRLAPGAAILTRNVLMS